ncbi:MAG: AMP-binding protein, partial [Deltaproteobacteria bacterium]|nr:AMP-binding protein [Deltaproteobacteria bacterium]
MGQHSANQESLIRRAACGFLDLGLGRGHVVSLFLPSLPELIIGYLGAVRAGLTVNVVNAMLKGEDPRLLQGAHGTLQGPGGRGVRVGDPPL